MVQYMPKQRGNCLCQMESKHYHQVLCKLPDKVQLQVRIGVSHIDFIAAPFKKSLQVLAGCTERNGQSRQRPGFRYVGKGVKCFHPARSMPGTSSFWLVEPSRSSVRGSTSWVRAPKSVYASSKFLQVRHI